MHHTYSTYFLMFDRFVGGERTERECDLMSSLVVSGVQCGMKTRSGTHQAVGLRFIFFRDGTGVRWMNGWVGANVLDE